ncbi:3-oxo-5-alpha-steroid 4-dehydrogenase 2a [Trichomycterus rosablanca]|uniref:3-oxo-5-alpha-steroid 4-dehydrogenase 2a n=1 Tax=Trichomycterus rosablanca TaxID=2290929 RepID=UPI002F35443C
MLCQERTVHYLSWSLIIGGLLYFLRQIGTHTPYGRYVEVGGRNVMVPAKVAWLVQELPSFLIPVLLMLSTESTTGLGRNLLLGTFCLHYFHRTFIYSLLTKGTASPLSIVVSAAVFCSLNGFLQGHAMLHCVRYDASWRADVRFVTGLVLFFTGMGINIHSDHVLRNLRKPGEVTYKIPKGGMFELVSGANFFGEILEWWGYALATWTLPAFAFALFTACSIGPRALHHHRYYLKNFDDYPKTRKAVIPFLL